MAKKKAAQKTHLVECTGAAHSNIYIDNCAMCMPRWGVVEIPIQYATLEAYRDALDAARDKEGE